MGTTRTRSADVIQRAYLQRYLTRLERTPVPDDVAAATTGHVGWSRAIATVRQWVREQTARAKRPGGLVRRRSTGGRG